MTLPKKYFLIREGCCKFISEEKYYRANKKHLQPMMINYLYCFAPSGRQKRTWWLILLLNAGFFLPAGAQNAPFWTENFAGESIDLPAGWTTQDLSDNDTPTLWQRCPTGAECPPTVFPVDFLPADVLPAVTESFLSATADNGYAYALSQSDGETAHEAVLTSPVIDLPAGGEVLFLEFQSFVQTFHLRENQGARLSVQADGGAWQSVPLYPAVENYPTGQLQKTLNANTFLLNLSDLAAAANIRLRWEWTGMQEVVLCLDDVKLLTYNPLDVRKIWDGGQFGGGLNGWTINTVGPNDCTWQYEPFGRYGTAYLPQGNDNKFINSPTFYNGAVLLNGDFCYTNNTLPTAPLDNFPFIVAELISPTIDLSETTEEVLLDFYQVIRKFELTGANAVGTPCYWAYSTDDGETWSERLPLNEDVSQNLTFHTHQTLVMPPQTVGAAAVRIKFIFDGKLFYWGIDDVRILERPAVDLRISPDFYAVAPSRSVPVAQRDSVPFLADVENFGTMTQSDVWLIAEVENILTEEILYRDSIFIPSIEPLNLAENLTFPAAFFPPNDWGRYRGTYRVRAAETDVVPENNAVSFDFSVNKNEFAKESNASFGFKPPNRNYRWGNCFYVKNGAGIFADSVKFGIENIEQMSGRSVQTEIYAWQNDESDFLHATPDEYELIANNFYFVEGNESGLISVPADFSEEPVPLADDTHYIVTVRYEQAFGDGTNCFLSASQEADYLAMYFASDLRDDLRYATMTDNGSTGIFDIIGLGSGSGFNIVPQVRMVTYDPATVGSTSEIHPASLKMSLSPNPAARELTVYFSEKTAGMLTLFDDNGTNISTFAVRDDTIRRDITRLPDGIYYLHFVSDDGQTRLTRTFVKVR